MTFLNHNPTLARIKVVSAALLASPTAEMLEDYAALYMDGSLPYRLYRSNGTALVEIASGGGSGGVAVSGGASSQSTGTIIFSNASGITFGLNGGTMTATVKTDYASSNHSHGNPTLNLTNLSGTTASNSAGLTLSLSAAAPGAGAAISAAGGSVSNGTVVFSNSNGVSFGMNGSTITATVTPGAAAGIAAAAAGTQTGTSGTLVFANSNGLTFGMSGSSQVTASHNGLTTAAQSNHSHGNPTLNLTNLSGTTASNSAGLTLSLSANAPGAATLTAYAVSNTTQSTSGTIPGSVVSLQGNGGVSVGVSNGSIVVSGPSLTSLAATGALSASSNGNTISLGVGTVTASATSNTTQGSSGTINLNALVLHGAGGASVGISNGSIVISGATGGGGGGGGGVGLGVSTMGNTAGTTGTVTTGNVVLVGSGVMSLSQSSSGSNATISILAPATSSLSATGNASISVNGSTISLGANAAAVSISGNSTSAGAGYSNVSTGTVVFAGGNNITLSQNGASITISGANAGGAQTGISGLQVSDTTYTSGTVTFQNANGISFGSSGANGISASYTRPVVSNAIQLVGTATNSGTNTSRFAADDHVHEGVFAAGVSTGGNTAGDTAVGAGRIVLQGGNNVTVSQITAAGGLKTVVISGAATGAADGINALVVNGGASTATTTLTLSNSNNVSFGHNAGVITATATFAQSAQTVGLYASSQTTGQSSSSTVDARSITLVGQGNISVGLSGGSFLISQTGGGGGAAISAAGASASNGTVVFSNSNNVSFGMNGSTVTATATVPAQTVQTLGGYFVGNTTGQSSSSTWDARTLSIDGAGIVSAGWSAGSIRISATQSGQAFSAGAASSAFQTLSFQDSNGVSFSNNAGAVRVTHDLAGTATAITGGASMTVNSGGISFNGTALAGTGTTFAGANISASMTMNSAGLNLSASVAAPGAAAENNNHNLLGANTAGNTTASGSTIGLSGINMTLSGTNGSVINLSVPATSSLSATGQVSISTNGSTISIGVPNPIFSTWNNLENVLLTTVGQQANNSASIVPMRPDENVSATRFEVFASMNVGTAGNNSTAAANYSMSVYLATLNGATLSTLSSASTATGITWSSNNTSGVTGGMIISVPLNASITPARYQAIVHLSTAATGNVLTGANTTSLGHTLTMIGVGTAQFGALSFRPFTSAATASSIGVFSGGLYSSTGNLTQISMSAVSQAGTFGARGGAILMRFLA